MASAQHDVCPVCQSARIQPKYKVNHCNLVACAECSLIFVKERFTDDQLRSIYENLPDNFAYTDDDNKKNLGHYFLKLKRLIEMRMPSGRILDVGCTDGSFLDLMAGWDCYGSEISPPSFQAAQRRYGDHIFAKPLSELTGFGGFFDVITLQDVFDHMPDPAQALAQCQRMLKPGGLLVVKVHNIHCLYARFTGRHFYAIIPPTHLFYYSPRSIRVALEKSGFHTDRITFISQLLFLKTVAFRLSQERTVPFFYELYKLLSKSPIGKIKIYKNFNDVMTVLATKTEIKS